ncbi:unnamed protein product [Withania somnifera]
MNEGSNNDSLLWDEWPFLNSNSDVVGSGEKLPDSNRVDACQLGVETITVGGKRSSDNRKDGEAKSDAGATAEKGDHEIHIWTERERRKKMRNMFENLHALLPQLPPKADKSTIVDEAVNYIKTLQNTFKKLQQQKLERFQHGIGLFTMNDSIMTSQKLTSVGSSWEQYLADQGSASNSAAITPTNHNNNVSGSPLLINNLPTGFQTWSSPNVVLNICGEEAHISVCCPKKPGLFSFICYVLEKHKIDIVSAQVSSDHFRSMFMIQAHARGESGLDQFSNALSMDEEMYKKAATEIMSWVAPN